MNVIQTSKSDPILEIFALYWGFFSVLHYVVYATQFGLDIFPTTYLIGILGFALIARPSNLPILLGLFFIGAVDAYIHAPVGSNHTIIKNFFLVGFLIYAIQAIKRGFSASELIDTIAPLGRFLLLVMYFFGVFHKLNTDFLNPQTSCAAVLWSEMPLGLTGLDSQWVHYLTIYGTLIIETIIFTCLLFSKTRLIAVTLGIAFHSLLALSGYAFYGPFTFLTIALHLLFLTRPAAENINANKTFKSFKNFLAQPPGIAGCVVFFYLVYLLSNLASYSQASLLSLLLIIPLIVGLTATVRDTGNSPSPSISLLVSKNHAVNAISLAFLINGFFPYLGLKTAQSINMFANLRLEESHSNHLIFSGSRRPFSYLEDTVQIIDSKNSIFFSYINKNDLRLVYYDFLSRMDRNRDIVVSFEHRGKQYDSVTAIDLDSEIRSILHPALFRKYFHFNPVDLTLPKPCAVDR